VNATGIISTSNPAAEQVLGIRGLGFRRYSEALGASSEMTKLVAECLSSGRISGAKWWSISPLQGTRGAWE